MRKTLARLGKLLLLASLALVAFVVWLWPRYPYLPPATDQFAAERIGTRPILDAATSDALAADATRDGYSNLNFPTLIRVPDWVDGPLGRYYLYFSHHKGDRIRLAYSDDVRGPWTVHNNGVLAISESGFPSEPVAPARPNQALEELLDAFSLHVVRDYLILNHQATVTDEALRRERGIAAGQAGMPHIASPDIFIDDMQRKIYMYYHGLEYGTRQLSRIAVSDDGLSFAVLPGTIPSLYLRAFEFRGAHYLLGMPGVLFRSDSPAGPFEPRDRILFEPRMRHAGLWRDGDMLYVVWSRVGEAPERLLLSEIDLSSTDWADWRATEGRELLRAELPWEGSDLPAWRSIRGELPVEENELRDPYVFIDRDGRRYLLYVGRGEKAIGIADLKD